jgi:hypothetical protein
MEKQADRTDHYLRLLGWAYIILLVIEGALRKWVLPGFSDALLLIRDPLVILAYVLCFGKGKFPTNQYVLSGAGLMLLYSTLTLLFGHGNLLVTLFGVRTNFLHIPFVFIIGRVFTPKDVVEIGRWWLWATIPMTALIVLQFYSPQSAWINLSVGGAEGGGFSGALGRYRPPGTFSFTIGTTFFYAFSTAFLVAGLTQHNRYSKSLLILAGGSVLLAIPISISRALILLAGMTFTVGILTSGLQKHSIIRLLRLGLIAAVALFIVSKIPFFEEALEVFMTRWEKSTGAERGGVNKAIIGRILKMFTDPFVEADQLPLLGHGIGAGTQVGTRLLTGERGFGLGEWEWERIIGESGVVLGCLFILWRVALSVKITLLSLGAVVKGNSLPLILFSTTAFNLLTGQWGQTTIYGFTIVGTGLTIASIRLPKRKQAGKAKAAKSVDAEPSNTSKSTTTTSKKV